MELPSIDYTNYKGERRLRDVVPISIRFVRENPYHGNAWVLEAYDIGKCEVRVFDLKCIHNPEILDGLLFAYEG